MSPHPDLVVGQLTLLINYSTARRVPVLSRSHLHNHLHLFIPTSNAIPSLLLSWPTFLNEASRALPGT